MPNAKLDFGLLIAYFVPGFTMLHGASPGFPALQALLKSGQDEKAIISAFAVVGLSLVLGMLISVIRALLIDWTYQLDLPECLRKDVQHHLRIPHCEIDYSKLTPEGALNAYLEAKAAEKRPYQFYGNTLVAIILTTIAQLAAHVCGDPNGANFLWWATAALVTTLILYPASRRSYFRFMRAVRGINGAGA